MSIATIEIDGESLDMEKVFQVAQKKAPVKLSPKVSEVIKRSRNYIETFLKSDAPVYGVNTGFGAFSSVKISEKELSQLQKNLIRSHSVGIGDAFSETEVRAILLLRANTLVRGHSGVRLEVIEKLLEFLNKDLIPFVPEQGSVGASGDLAPLAHVALALMGEGEIFFHGKKVDAAVALKEAGVQPLELQAKEGLSLINGCQVMTAVGLLAARHAKNLCFLTDLAGAMSIEGLKGSRSAFDPLISAVRAHPGEAKTARNIMKILGKESGISKSHLDCDRVQDAYSLRCMPQVHGAAKDALSQTIKTLEIEANSSTDNPLVFADEEKILSCGNFHGEPVAFALDFAAISTSAQASISECRIEKLVNPSMSGGLPAFLTKDGGFNSGMMIVQVAAASLVSENKILSHPASVDSIPTSADKEDHVSMGTIAARKFRQIVKNAQNVVAMELLCAAQALDFLKPLAPAAGVQMAYGFLRTHISFASEDRAFYRDIDKVRTLIQNDELLEALKKSVGELEF